MTANPTSSEDAARTPLAILMALALVLPGLLLGGLAALFYSALMAGWDEGGQWNPNFVGLFEAVWIDLMPHVIRGTVAITELGTLPMQRLELVSERVGVGGLQFAGLAALGARRFRQSTNRTR